MSNDTTEKNVADLSNDGADNGVSVIDWPQIYTDKANAIKELLNGLSQQDIKNVFAVFEGMLPNELILFAPPR